MNDIGELFEAIEQARAFGSAPRCIVVHPEDWPAMRDALNALSSPYPDGYSTILSVQGLPIILRRDCPRGCIQTPHEMVEPDEGYGG